MQKELMFQIGIVILFLAGMYFLLIKPQKKREKTVSDMRKSVQVGDEIISIGGIYGKIVKTKEESVVIQVGADKVKFELARWGISSVISKSTKVVEEEKEEKKIKPKKLGSAKKSEETDDAEADNKQQ